MRNGTEIQSNLSGVTIRRLGGADAAAVARLVQLDSADAPAGDLLGAEVEGRLVAVAPIAGGETIADPFDRTFELQALLELRAEQIRGRDSRRRRLGGFLGRRGGRSGVPSAPVPPGAGGRLVRQALRPN